MELKSLKIDKTMSKDKINELIGRYILLDDDEYKGCEHPHNWICKGKDGLECGNLIEGRMWNNIRKRGSVLCKVCKFNTKEVDKNINKLDRKGKLREEHKKKVESVKGYNYIKSYFMGDILSDGKTKVGQRDTHIRVKHGFCQKEYDVKLRVFINKRNDKKGYKCPMCCGSIENSIYHQDKEIADMIKYDENKNNVNTKLIYSKSHSKFYFECNKCNNISNEAKRLDTVRNFGYSCYICGDGVSTPEKFVANILAQLNIKFNRQEVFDWSKNVDEKVIKQLGLDVDENIIKKLKGKKKYDFYIEYENQKIIIEVNGIQHYKKSTLTDKTLEEEQYNDKLKKILAEKVGLIDKYIVIDCRYSEYDYMKINIIKELEDIVNIDKLNLVNYESAYNESQNSLKVSAWNLYNNGKKVKDIAEELYMSKSRIREYLKDGTKIKKCDYDPVMDRNSNRIKINLVYENTVIKELNSLNELYLFLEIKKELYDKYIGSNNDIININLIKESRYNQYTKKLINKLERYDGYKIIKVM